MERQLRFKLQSRYIPFDINVEFRKRVVWHQPERGLFGICKQFTFKLKQLRTIVRKKREYITRQFIRPYYRSYERHYHRVKLSPFHRDQPVGYRWDFYGSFYEQFPFNGYKQQLELWYKSFG